MRTGWNALLLSFAVTGCITNQPTTGGYDPDDDGQVGEGTNGGGGNHGGSGGDAEPPPPPPPPPPTPTASGAYSLRSQIDLTVEALLPEPAADLVATLRDFSQHPAHTLLDVAEDTGVPAVAEIRDALPSYVEDKLEGWIDGEIAKLQWNGTPITAIAGQIAGLAETSLTTITLESELAVVAHAPSSHRLTAIVLAPTGTELRFGLDQVPSQIANANPTCSVDAGSLRIGEHGYSIAYGEYVWTATNAALVAQYGADARGLLAAAIDCPSLATTISQKCYWDYCVGHRAQLIEICERGIDEIVERAHAKVTGMKFDAVRFITGDAVIADDDGDLVGDRLVDGVWTAEIDAGMGLRGVPATFAATR